MDQVTQGDGFQTSLTWQATTLVEPGTKVGIRSKSLSGLLSRENSSPSKTESTNWEQKQLTVGSHGVK